jgi:RecJ-like exonuclease
MTKFYKPNNILIFMGNKLLKDITFKDVGKKMRISGQITNVKQTSGPTLMVINDGSANFTLKAFKKPGVRAYPEADLNDFIDVEVTINERNGGVEGEVSNLRKLSGNELDTRTKNLESLKEEQYKVKDGNFFIKSKAFDLMKPSFLKVASIIKKAVINGRPILLRHHADCDGYAAALSIEGAIMNLMEEVYGSDMLVKYQNYRRAPSKAPFYEYEDAVKDVAYWLRDKVKNGVDKAPLVIITDNGSTEEDILSIKQMQFYGSEVVVIDHHYPGEVKKGKVLVDKYISAHINPYLHGYDSNICAGMLGFELARYISPQNNNKIFIPAMAAILDHCDGPEKEFYVKAAQKEGYDEDFLKKLGEIIDLQSHYVKFSESRELFDEIFRNADAQKLMVEMLTPELKNRYSQLWKVAEHYSKVEDYGKFYLVAFDGELGVARGEYPAVGKSTNHVHAKFEEKLDKPVITMTYGPTFVTIRVADAINGFAISEFVEMVKKDVPFTAADGGGHERVGSIKFVEYGRDDVIALFKKYLKEVNKRN